MSDENNFSHYAGKALNGLVELTKDVTYISLIVGGLVYTGMTFAYGPYDAGKVIYAELSGNKSLKHRTIKEAEALFAKRIVKRELIKEDLKNLYLELNVVSSEGKKPTEDDISWYRLLDWIEDNNQF